MLHNTFDSPHIIAGEASDLQFESRFHNACALAFSDSTIKFPIKLLDNNHGSSHQ